jgi:hypothetical protein
MLSFSFSFSAYSMELSLLSGGYRTTEAKSSDTTILEKTELKVGGRIYLPSPNQISWYGLVDLSNRSYDVPSPRTAPKGSTNLSPGIGLRYRFAPLAPKIIPFLGCDLRLVSDRDVRLSAPSEEIHTSGLYYQGHTGFRFVLSPSFFTEIEATLVSSAITGRRKVSSTDEGNNSSSETKTTSLWLETQTSLSDIQVALGFKI